MEITGKYESLQVKCRAYENKIFKMFVKGFFAPSEDTFEIFAFDPKFNVDF